MKGFSEIDSVVLESARISKEYKAVVDTITYKNSDINFKFRTTKEFKASLNTLSKTIGSSYVKLALTYFHQESYIIMAKEGATISNLYNTLNSYHSNINQNSYLVECWSNNYINKKYNRLDKSDKNYELYISTQNLIWDLTKIINLTTDLFFGQLVLHSEAKKINQFVEDKLDYHCGSYDSAIYFSYSKETAEALRDFSKKFQIKLRDIFFYGFKQLKAYHAKNLISHAGKIKSDESKQDLKTIINKIKKDSEILNDTTKSFHIMNMDGELTTDIILLMNKNISNSVKLYTKINKDLKRIIDNEINNNR